MSRKDKEPTRAQLSSRLSYQQHVPAFIQKLKNKVSGTSNDEDYDDDDEFGRRGRALGGGEGYGDNDEWEYVDDGSGRPPIPRRPRPPIPERPADEPGSEDDEDGDEKPQVVVLKEGKHLTEREAENVRRKEKGLAPLQDPVEEKAATEDAESSSKTGNGKVKASAPSLSFSSSAAKSNPSKSFKRKVLGGDDSEEENGRGSRGGGAARKEKEKKEPPKKKSKKSTKTLLSFGDDA